MSGLDGGQGRPEEGKSLELDLSLDEGKRCSLDWLGWILSWTQCLPRGAWYVRLEPWLEHGGGLGFAGLDLSMGECNRLAVERYRSHNPSKIEGVGLGGSIIGGFTIGLLVVLAYEAVCFVG